MNRFNPRAAAFFLSVVLLVASPVTNLKAQQAGDTIYIQTFTYGSNQDSFFVFPPDTIRYEKALMHYTLKCPSNGICGPTDKITNTYLTQHTHTYDSSGIEILNYFELGRYITPYGDNLNLGNGFTWTYDVSDYVTLLHDTVYLSAGNGQEALNMSFELIKGIPPRDPVKIEDLWRLSFDYSHQDTLPLMSIKIDSAAQNFRLKLRTTGHGELGNVNCAEFCPKRHYLSVNGVQRWDTLLWRNNCSYNPLYPQGGTWIYNRANWCPGADVTTYNFELTPYVTPGDSVALLYCMDPSGYTSGGNPPSYFIESQLVSYNAPNFTLDAGIWDIKAPSTNDIYSRINPICSQPLISIENTGTTTLTSLTITYGIEGGQQSVYNWTGNLGFLQTEDVTLPPFNWSNASNIFKATVSSPNGGVDQYPNNNSMESICNYPPEYASSLIFDLLTDTYSSMEDSYTIKDGNGNIVFQRNNLSDVTQYRDTVNLPDGCYEFKFEDDWGVTNPDSAGYNQGDGMTNWPDASNTVGHMYIRAASNNRILKNFINMDFGHELFQQFTVGYYLSVPEQTYEEVMAVYPNPSKGVFNLDMSFSEEQDVVVAVYDMMGRQIYSTIFKNVFVNIQQIDLTNQPNGIYFINAQSKNKRISRKLIKQ